MISKEQDPVTFKDLVVCVLIASALIWGVSKLGQQSTENSQLQQENRELQIKNQTMTEMINQLRAFK